MSPLFKRFRENFTCLHCGVDVFGNGYTNHCPACLWSRHVDIFPGDRAAECLGMMEPASLFLDHGIWGVLHRCLVCGHEKRNRLDDQDSRRALADIVRR
ncbi:MAG: RNHCP domain-containing protein [Candidatus Moraniibacteriota bacterium]|nr:MAG: RNHCP domain-containing protein [Candidatus Moranbacteria bacterium]